MHWLRGLVLVWLAASCAWAQQDLLGAASPFGRKRAVRARLMLSHEVAKPGDTVMAAIELNHSPGWHTYWRNPGDSGEATEIHWALTNGISAGEIQWPVPDKLTDASLGLVTYVFHNRAVLLVPIKIGNDAPRGTHDLNALVKWLECSASLCVPGSNLVTAALTIGTESKLSDETNFFAEAKRHFPRSDLAGAAAARWDSPPNISVRQLLIEWNTPAKSPDFFPFLSALATISNRTDVVANSSNVVLRKLMAKTGDRWPAELAGLLVREENGASAGYEVNFKLADAVSGSVAPGLSITKTKSFWTWLGYAFLGGLILNIMPCVLPVLALKILGFVNQSREHPKRIRMLGLLYTLGVVASFLVLAGLVIGVKAAGQKAGWGMQFSNPQFIVALTVIVTLVALNLFGVFEITLSGRAMGLASEAASHHGATGAFMNGVLATLLATPCTAPFLGAALGFAFVQPSPIICLFFITIALGLASPYLLLSWNPRWLKLLPKPGPWMERFKVAMGFPMIATAVWLLSLASPFYGERSWWLGVFLVFVGAAAWTYGNFVQLGRRGRVPALIVTALLLATGYVWALDGRMRWRAPDAGSNNAQASNHSPEGYSWGRWSEEAVAQARKEGRPVVVDFTAKWCLTCNVSVKPAFENKAVIERLKSMNTIALLGDYTLYPPEISRELEKFERSGVPLVLVYPADASKPPLVLPEPLPFVPYAPTILEALAKAQ